MHDIHVLLMLVCLYSLLSFHFIHTIIVLRVNPRVKQRTSRIFQIRDCFITETDTVVWDRVCVTGQSTLPPSIFYLLH